ncbi:MAG: diaminopropionate ammonia-lyase [Saprospiraceae bacterium]|nr:diaminopropionate ammonia-lyase [Saprospiraceae bacterium]
MKTENLFFINNPNNEILHDQTTALLKEGGAYEYHKSLLTYEPTSFYSLKSQAKKYHVSNIYVKDEATRFGLNAFKSLGASFAINEVLKKKPDLQTFCTATDGNHGRAVAWAASSAGKKSIVYVPKDTSKNRIEAISNEGAQVIQLDKNYDETCAHAERKSVEEGWELVQDTAWDKYETIPALIMAGYQTQFIELEDDLHTLPIPKIDLVFLQAGVGSWAGSAIWYYLNRYGIKHPKIVIVEPYESAGILASFKAGRRVVPSGNFETIMGGLNCGIPSLTAWDIIKNGANASMKISDHYAKKAMRTFYHPDGSDKRIVAGESGVGGFAGFIALMTDSRFGELKDHLEITKGTNVLFYNTEGATDIDSFNSIVKEKK